MRSVTKAIGEALFVFETEDPTRDALLKQITGGQTPAETAQSKLTYYLDKTGCEILNDDSLVTTRELFDSYFKSYPPFGLGKKKSEFPDALALNALEATAKAREIAILVVSKDGDWRNFCEKSERLYLVSEIETALSLLNDPPLVVSQAILAWLEPEADGRLLIEQDIKDEIEKLYVEVNGHSSAGDMEADVSGMELHNINWPQNAEIDIIGTSEVDESGVVSTILSIPLSVDVSLAVDLSFSVWDSVDREAISMGGRSVLYNETYDILATVTVSILNFGKGDQEIEYISCEIDQQRLDLELGEVEIFEPEDYED